MNRVRLMLQRFFLTFLMSIAALAANAAERKSAPIDFKRDISAILSDNCFSCHGPDDKERKSKLRLDRRDDAIKPAKSGEIAIVPGNPALSELLKRITSTDEDAVMPPPKTKRTLTASQKELLKRWIAEGAKWSDHWAYAPPVRPTAPEVGNRRWPKNDIDRFILDGLEREKLKPSPETDKTHLIRRATYDVTGLPPTPQEIDAFLADKTPAAYEKVVDRLLESPAYGENMARYWMDAARYADTHGFHIDSERSMWKWRDWVIEAFNKNMPFDQFTVEQLAGDLLPNPTTEQKIASGYIRSNMSTGEGGAITEEYQAKYTFDRTETTATIWLGLTMTCARCHTHKYDPIQNSEYYGLYAFFNNLNESVMDGNKPNPDPFISLPSHEQSQRRAQLKTQISEGQAKLDAPMPELDQKQIGWEKEWREKLGSNWTLLKPDQMKSTAGAQLTWNESGAILVRGTNAETDVFELTTHLEKGNLAGLKLETLPHESLPKHGSARADDGKFNLSELEAEIIDIAAEGGTNKTRKLKFTLAEADAADGGNEVGKAIDGNAGSGWSPGVATNRHVGLFLVADPARVGTNSELVVRLKFENGKDRRALGHFRITAAQNDDLVRDLNPPKSSPWKVLGPFKSGGLHHGFTNVFEPETKVDLAAAYPGVREEIKWGDRTELVDGKNHLLVNELHGVHGVYYLHRTLKVAVAGKMDITFAADDLFKLWVNDELVTQRAEDKREAGPVKVTVQLRKGENKFLAKVVNLQGDCYFSYNQFLEGSDSLPTDVGAVLAVTETAAGAHLAKLRNFYRRSNSEEFRMLSDETEKRRAEDAAIEKAVPTTLVAKESDKLRETFMLTRGEYDQKAEKVAPHVPAFLNPFPATAATNRLGLAKWIVDPANPLTARVTINRLWQQFFGVGLVKTAEDFGVQGETPSNQALLDWLATEFVRSGWNVKGIQRLMLTSATYRQRSATTPQLLARDPENRLLARGPRFRLDGESIRDTALSVGGLLVNKPGGKSVKPYQPGGLWEAVSFNNSQKYVQDKDDGQYRRSLYTHWKRQSPPPNMMLFDAPTREYCVVRRPRTNTPLQALALLNDVQFVEASRAFAQRILLDGGKSDRDRASFAFRLATGRLPDRGELSILLDTLAAQRKEFSNDHAAATKLLSVGSFKAKENLDAAELAAWANVASLILNLDETVTKS
ncbi:MAG: PSD1 domain-containing protein [Opitutaceae bacterium]|nr:PSD1 domain-containing protein [Verrucomicrobiales bacterium]